MTDLLLHDWLSNFGEEYCYLVASHMTDFLQHDWLNNFGEEYKGNIYTKKKDA